MIKTDEEIMSVFQAGDNQAVEELYMRYKKQLFNFCLRILENRADAEDVTAEVFLNLFKKQYQYTEGAKFSTWLYTIARNGCIDRIRKRKVIVSMSNSTDNPGVQWEIEDTTVDIKSETIRKETHVLVRRAIAKLDLEQKEAIVLREYQNYSYQDIAEVLGCSLEKVKILIYRARERLKGELASIIKEGEENE